MLLSRTHSLAGLDLHLRECHRTPCDQIYMYTKTKAIYYLSVHDMKNHLCLFERPLKVQKYGIFLFKISFFVLEILIFFCYAN